MNKFKEIIKIILNILSYILIIILSIYLILIIYQKIVGKEELISFGNYYVFEIASGSMEYNLLVGDYIIVKKEEEYKVGDVITYKESGYYITHRIVDIKGENITTKGDANTAHDEPITKDNVLGKLMFRSNILSFINKNKPVIVILIIGFIIIEIVGKDKKRKNK